MLCFVQEALLLANCFRFIHIFNFRNGCLLGPAASYLSSSLLAFGIILHCDVLVVLGSLVVFRVSPVCPGGSRGFENPMIMTENDNVRTFDGR